MEWYKWHNAQWYRLTRGMTKDEKADFIDATVDALEDGREGVTPLADRMLKEAAEYSQKQRERAASHGEPRRAAASHGEPRRAIRKKERNQSNQSNHKTNSKSKTPTNQSNQPQPRARALGECNSNTPPARVGVGVGVGVKKTLDGVGKPLGMVETREAIVAGLLGSPKTAVWEITDSMLPELAVSYCKPERPKVARAGFVNMLHAIGGDAFRRELGRFISEDEQGEMSNVENMGGCLMERLKKCKAASNEGTVERSNLDGQKDGSNSKRTCCPGSGPRIPSANYVDDPFS